MSNSVKDFLSKDAQQRITKAIQIAEKNTTGEIRIRIDAHTKTENILDDATRVFYELKMDKTVYNNGVLLYIAVKDKSYCIVGDTAINQIVHQQFWDTIAAEMNGYFSKQEFEAGIIHVIEKIGQTLHQYFPTNELKNDNELSDDISFG
jgi:uncharacterized membrane protein